MRCLLASSLALSVALPCAAQSVLVKDINPGIASSTPDGLTDADGLLYLVAYTPHYSLWVVSPTGGAALVMEFKGAPKLASVAKPCAVGSRVFFRGWDAAAGYEPWVSDGTAAGTKRIGDLHGGTKGSDPEDFHWNGAHVLFRANLFHQLVLCRAPVGGGDAVEVKSSPRVTNVRALVPFRSGVMMQVGPGALYFANGDDLGTTLLAVPGTIAHMTEFAGVLWFSGGPANDEQLWISDGSSSGTHRFKQLRTNGGAKPDGFAPAGRWMYFRATTDTGELGIWRTDGTVLGTVLLHQSFGAGVPAAAGEKAVFAGGLSNNIELWKSDPILDKTEMLADIRFSGSSSPAELTSIGSRYVWFSAIHDNFGRELYRTDGDKVEFVEDIGVGSSNPKDFATAGRNLFFTAAGTGVGTELYRLDAGGYSKKVGQGCSALRPEAPLLTATDPVIGKNVALACTGAPDPSVVALLLGKVTSAPFAFGQCLFYLDLTAPAFSIATIPVSNTTSWEVTLRIPQSPSVNGVQAGVQAMHLPLPFLGTVENSNAVLLTVGDR